MLKYNKYVKIWILAADTYINKKVMNNTGYISQGYNKAFIPNEINRVWEINDMQVLNLLSQADRVK